MVLVIDDDSATLYALARRLTHKGFLALAAADAEEGLKLLAERRATPFAIVLDWKLPGASGSEALRTIRADRGLALVPVIVYSGYLDEDAEREAMKLGATECVAKGARPGDDDLFTVLDRYLPGS